MEFFVERGPITLDKQVNHVILEYRGESIEPDTRSRFDSSNGLVVPVMPPTLSTGICRLLRIHYILRVRVAKDFHTKHTIFHKISLIVGLDRNGKVRRRFAYELSVNDCNMSIPNT